MFRYALFLILVPSCTGQADLVEPVCPAINGKFNAEFTLLDGSSGCEFVHPDKLNPLTFENGEFDPRLGFLAKCHTYQSICDISVQCTSSFIDARMDFQGHVTGDTMTGEATISGSLFGCTYLKYKLDAVRVLESN